MTEIFSNSLRKGWGEWEIRVMVLISLMLQSVLILLGSKRKHCTRNCLKLVLWLAYLSADALATVALSVISIKHLQLGGEDYTNNPSYVVSAFWAPFLLLHLGGPDAVTAYSLEDNQLWWRHFLMLLVQVGVAFHVFLRAWTGNLLNFLSIPMIIAGIIKFGERTWVLRSASSECFRQSMFPSPDPGPNYARYMAEFQSKQDEGFIVSLGKIIEAPIVGDHVYCSGKNDVASLQHAFNFFKIFKRLFADLILSVHDVANSLSFFKFRPFNEAFAVIEIELGFTHDVFYTKAALAYSRNGVILRFLSFSFVVSVFVAFFLSETAHSYSTIDIIITYILLVGAIGLEVHSVFLLLISDWTMLLLSRNRNKVTDLLYRAILTVNPPSKNKRWSNVIAQYSLISLCLKDKPARNRYLSFLENVSFVNGLMEKYLYKSYVKIPEELKELIFKQLQKKTTGTLDFTARRNFCAQRGRWALEKHEGCLERLIWSVEDVEFDESVLLWHIMTDLLYHTELQEHSSAAQSSKLLSDYMMYLLVMRPFMLPNGIGQIRFQDTRAEAAEFLEERRTIADVKRACFELREVCTDILPSEVKGDRSKSVLFDACRLAEDLHSLETEQGWGPAKKWELVSHVWVEMLSHAASQCQRSQHAQQLRQGGELLTHVWLLMAHLGITEQFQISKGYARARLNVQ